VSVVSEAPPVPSARRAGGPAALDAIVMKMLAKDRDARYASPKELLDDLRAATTGTFVMPPAALAEAATAGGAASITTHIPTPPPPAVPRSAKARRALTALGAAAAVIVIAVLALTLRRVFEPPQTAPVTQKSTSTIPYLAVEPFKNLAEDPKAEFFAVGLTEALQSRLAGIKGMYVVDAGSELGIKTTLEGGVQRSNDRLRITYRIVDRESGENIGGGVIEGGIAELFDLQDRATREISTALADEFGLAAISEPGPRPTSDVTAYDLYLQARGYLRRFEDERNVDVAIEVFNKALERDPGMPLALAGLGEAYWKRYEKTKDPRFAALAEEVAVSALKKDATLAESHVTLGTIYIGTGKPDSAASAFTRAIAIDPESDAAYRGLAKAEEGLGDLTAAEQTFQKAIAAKPDYWAGHNDLGSYYYRHGEFEKAAACFQQVVDLTPENPRGYSNLGAMYASLDRARDAVVAYEKSLALKPNYRAYSNLATMYNDLGRGAEAAEMYEKALDLDDRDYRVWASLGAVLRGLPDRSASVDSAFRRAVDLGEAQLMINPNDALLLAFLAEHHAVLGDDERARDLAKKAVATAPNQVDVLVRAAGAFEKIGERTSALATIRTAIEGGWSPEAPGADSPLAPLFADPKFREIVAAVETAKKR
jgi:Tfp pilus assembly protein PilF/TolB-like protein